MERVYINYHLINFMLQKNKNKETITNSILLLLAIFIFYFELLNTF